MAVHAQADLADPRFAPLFSDPDFALDPTNPRFAQAGGAAAMAAAVARMRSAHPGAAAALDAPKAPFAGALLRMVPSSSQLAAAGGRCVVPRCLERARVAKASPWLSGCPCQASQHARMAFGVGFDDPCPQGW